MADSVLGIGGVLLVVAVVLFFVNPIIALVPLLLVFALVGFRVAAGLFKHAGASPTGEAGPAVPSTADAAYDARTDPSDRNV